jgi:cytochrome c oxidase cbb3-type subunit 3
LAQTPAIVAQGKAVFGKTCAPCHGADGRGGVGPNLTDGDWLHGGTPSDIYKSVDEGIAAKGMPAWGPQLGEVVVEYAVAFVLSMGGPRASEDKAPQGDPAAP